ncbi:hypothetical protein [Flavobacterium sp.]|uniref:hypothetical protein n=1 Tax=Flavobacterium sp. TaxID=239 RepID=UPI00120EB5D8|nr:hypothetical protein [Flavobacterium sp.]RZJ73231.1 MAG: hypothetical protein EOO49_02690 [Flavobacterium sp.]
MHKRLLYLAFIGLFLISCADEDKRAAEQQKEEKKKGQVFASISNNWRFNTNPVNPSAQKLIATWPAWRDLLREMSQKPQSNISAFQKKSKILSERVLELPKNIPPAYNKPAVKSRIAVLTTKINSINLFINLKDIPAAKINKLVADVNIELNGFQGQLDEIDRKAIVPKEQGEQDMLRLLDTARAIPDKGFKPEEVAPQTQNPQMPMPRPNGLLGGRNKKLSN